MIAGIKTENGSCDPDHAPFKDSLPSMGYKGHHLHSRTLNMCQSVYRSITWYV